MLQSADPRCYAGSLQISKPVIIPILFLVAAAEALSLFFLHLTMIMILVCLVLLALPLLWGKIKSTGGVGWGGPSICFFPTSSPPPLAMKCSYMAINIKMIVSHGLNSWKEGKKKGKDTLSVNLRSQVYPVLTRWRRLYSKNKSFG